MVKLNSKLKKIGAPILAGALVLSTAAFYIPQMGAANADTEKTINKNFPELLQNAESGDKSETVYAVLDADGNTDEISVSEWLKNSGSSKNIKDYSTLKNIKNTSGDEKVTQNGNDLVWASNGKDISYSGDYEGELPVKVNITYSLNGTEMSADEIAGKSGNVKIRFDYSINDNVSVSGYDMTRPYAILSAVVLSNDDFSNVAVNNGKAINDGNNTAVVGIALPGMSDDLDMNDLDIPDHVTITAKTTNFEIDGTYTVADSGFMSDTDTSKLDDASSDVDKLESSLNKLSSASKQLVSGTSKLASGATTLASSSSKIEDGTDTLATGAKKLDSGVDTLSSGVNTLVTGSKDLSSGTKQLKAGTAALEKAVADKDNEKSLTNSTKKLSAGASQVSDGVNTLVSSVATQNTQIASAVKGISDTLGTVNTETVTEPDHKDVDDKLTALIDKADKAGDTETKEALEAVQESLGTYEDSVKTTVDSVNTDSAKVTGAKSAADKLLATLAAASKDDSETSQSIKKLQKGAEGVADGTAALDKAVNEDTKNEKGEVTTLSLVHAVQQLNAGAGSLDAGVNGYTDKDGNFHMGAVQGLGQLQTGINKTLKSGTSQVSSGSTKISKYMSKLTDGADTLSVGTDTLSSSMSKFNKDGIQKLVSTMDDANLKSTVNRAQATIDAASEGSFVGGKRDDQTGESKIIFKTGEVKKADKSDK